MFGLKNTTAPGSSSSGKKYKPYRNRPSKRQSLLEILSFLLILVSAPAWLGGAISIFVCYFGIACGLIGLFAWTRRHAFLFAVLSFLLIGLCVVNIILRAVFTGQCLPFFNYGQQTSNGFVNGGDITSNHMNNQYSNSIWCGNNIVVYVTHALVILFALVAHVLALSLLFRRKANTAPVVNNQTTTRTVETKSYATA